MHDQSDRAAAELSWAAEFSWVHAHFPARAEEVCKLLTSMLEGLGAAYKPTVRLMEHNTYGNLGACICCWDYAPLYIEVEYSAKDEAVELICVASPYDDPDVHWEDGPLSDEVVAQTIAAARTLLKL